MITSLDQNSPFIDMKGSRKMTDSGTINPGVRLFQLNGQMFVKYYTCENRIEFTDWEAYTLLTVRNFQKKDQFQSEALKDLYTRLGVSSRDAADIRKWLNSALDTNNALKNDRIRQEATEKRRETYKVRS